VKGSSTITFEAVPVVLSDPATDVDGDGQLEDVNGDGNLTISDVQALFDSLDSSAVQNNVEEFDFNGDGEVNILDVQALFVQEQNNGGSQTQDLAGDQLEVR
jgi:PKD repeat protein